MKTFKFLSVSKKQAFLALWLIVFSVSTTFAFTMQGTSLGSFFEGLSSVQGTVTLVLVISGWINTQFNVPVDTIVLKIIKLRQLIAWIISLAIVFLSRYALEVGFIMEYEQFYQVLIQGVGVGLVANGVFDISLVQTLLGIVGAFKESAPKKAN